MTRRLSTLAAASLVAALLTAAAPASAEEPPGPITPVWTAAVAYSLAVAPNANTPGGNDWACRPDAAHPRPVVLVHGTFENRYDDWAWMAPQLQAAGYCIFALNYGDENDSVAGQIPGVYGTNDIRVSARELAVFVDDVLAATEAAKVDIVGHSQGGMMPRQYLKFEGGHGKVGALVTIGADHHGTTLHGLAALATAIGVAGPLEWVAGPNVTQQLAGSEFLTALNDGGDTLPGVAYTVIASKYDAVVTPYQSSFLTAGPGATVNNVTVQSGCPIDLSSHTSMVTSNRVVDLVLNALDPTHPRRVRCELHLPEV